MKVVLDTNILIASISKTSPHRIIFDAFLSNKFTLVISNEVLSEYNEMLAQKITPSIAESVIGLLLTVTNVELCEIFYKWNLIYHDMEDNKFADLAIAANADFLVSDDSHFNELKRVSFPKVNLISLVEFKNLLITSK